MVCMSVSGTPGTATTINLGSVNTGTNLGGGVLSAGAAGAVNGQIYKWLMTDGNNRELFYATYNSSGPSLTNRTTIVASVNGVAQTTPISATSNAIITSTAGAEDIVRPDSATIAATGNMLSGIGSGGAVPSPFDILATFTQSANELQGAYMFAPAGAQLGFVYFVASAAAPTAVVTPAIYSATTAAQLATGPAVTGVVAGVNKLPLSAPIAIAQDDILAVGVLTTGASWNGYSASQQSCLWYINGSTLPATWTGASAPGSTSNPIVWAAAPMPLPAPVSLGGATSNTGATCAITGVNAPAGSLVVVGVWESSSGGFGTLSDGTNNYSLATSVTDGYETLGLFYFYNPGAYSNATLTYTKHVSGGNALMSAAYSGGMAPTGTLDTTVTASTYSFSGSPSVAAAAAPAVANEWILGVAAWAGGSGTTLTNATPFRTPLSTIDLSTAVAIGGGSEVLANNGSAPTYSATLSPTGTWAAIIAGFKPAL
jgi:hypothetical protein